MCQEVSAEGSEQTTFLVFRLIEGTWRIEGGDGKEFSKSWQMIGGSGGGVDRLMSQVRERWMETDDVENTKDNGR